MTIQNLYPNIDPTLLLDFANVKALDPRITFARASAATYYGTDTAKAEENLAKFSQEFDNAGWSKTGTTVTPNTTVAPNGTTTAETLTEIASGTNQASISQGIVFISGLQYTVSVFIKQGTESFVQVLFGVAGFGGGAYANFNVTTGAGAVGTVGSSATASIIDVGNGWYRCRMTATATSSSAAPAQFHIIESATDARAPNITLNSGTVFLWGAQLEQRSTATAYTPTTTQPITNFVPVLESAAAGEARFDHNPVTGESLGLLIEESRTNLLLRSEEFDNASWGKSRSTITTNTIVAPDGTLTGDKLVEDTTASSTHHVTQNVTVSSEGATASASLYVKAAERSRVIIFIQNAADRVFAIFNLSTLTFSSGAAANASFTSAAITPVGNDWYRLNLVGSLAGKLVYQLQVQLIDNDNNQSYTGDGFSGIFIWGASLEEGAFPTSYVKTTTAQVTRAADAASMTGANFSSWFNQSEGTVYTEWDTAFFTAGSACRWSLNDGTGANRLRARLAPSGSTQARHDVSNNGVVTALGSPPGVQINGTKEAFSFASNAYTGILNAGTAVTSSTLVLPALTTLHMGNDSGVAAFLNGHIRKVSYYPKRIANDQLQGLTT